MMPSDSLLQKLFVDRTFVQTHPSVKNLRLLLDAIPQFNLTGRIFTESDKIETIGVGGFADVYLGYLAYGKGHKAVAVKRLRIHINPGFVKTLIRELGIWSNLDHPYVLSFLGYSFDDDNYYPMLVSEWMENGTIKSYIALHNDCDLPRMTLHIAEGLLYLHQQGIVHGDMKAAGEPKICDFGLSRAVVLSEEATASTSTTVTQGSARWMATELLEGSKYTEKTDAWAFGMTVCELLTNDHPYAHILNNFQVLVTIMQGITPSLPDNHSLWSESYLRLWKEICCICWTRDPEKRPGMAIIVQILKDEVDKSSSGSLRANDNSIMDFDASQRNMSLDNHTNHSSPQIVAPTFAIDERRRKVIEEGLHWTSTWQLAAISVKSGHTFVFYQVPGGGILQDEHKDGLWTGGYGSSPIFKAMLFTPLAVITTDDGKGLRIYYLDREYILQEYCYSAGEWYPGSLGDLKIRVASKSSIAAIKFEDQGLLQIRVYFQESDSNSIMEYGFVNMFWSERPRILPVALRGSSLAAVTYSLEPEGRQIRLFYQAEDQSIKELCFVDNYWALGKFYCGRAPSHVPISAIRCISSNGCPELHVYWKDTQAEIVRRRHSLYWSPIETVYIDVKLGTHFSVIQWEDRKLPMLYCQRVNGPALEIIATEVPSYCNRK